jgi:hypothetical protein
MRVKLQLVICSDDGREETRRVKKPIGQGEWDSGHCPNVLPMLCLE